MTERSPNPRAIELSAFCRRGQSVSGTWPLATLARLNAAFSAATDGEVTFWATGTLQSVAGAGPQQWLELNASAVVPLQCQRCLQTLAEPLQVQRRIRFVPTEEEAARLDEASDDDVLLQPGRLDLQELLEDELILALPLVPRHTVCPEPLDAVSAHELQETQDRAHPFAALAALRKR
ncbi:MAG: DUF177 domain-containing protein [Pseudomonadota bacterium]|nr:DUF177 domain-containing protein [Pseudomonadota bacterium]